MAGLGGSIGGFIAGDPVGAYQSSRRKSQEVDQGDVDAQAQAAAGNAYMGMFGQQQTPGAMPGQPQQGSAPGQPAAQPPQQHGLGGLLQGLLQKLQGAGGGGMQPQPPGGGMSPQPQMPPPGPGGAQPAPGGAPPGLPQQGAVPGARPMQMPGAPAPAPQQGSVGSPGPGMAAMPPSSASMPGQPQGAPGAPQGQPGALTWQSVVQQVVRANPGVKDPRVIAAAVDKFIPLMNSQSLAQWRDVQGQIRGFQAETGRENVDVRRDQGQQRLDQGGQRLQLTQDQMEQKERDFQQREQRLQEREQQITARQSTLEEGRNWRATLSSDTRKDLQALSIEARKEIAAQAEGGRGERAELSAKTRKEIAGMNNESRSELQGMLEGGRNRRADQAEGGRDTRSAAGITSREKIAGEAESGRDYRANLSAEAKSDIARLNTQSRAAIQEYLEAGRETRSARTTGERGREADQSDATRKALGQLSATTRRELESQREGASAARTQAGITSREGIAGRSEAGREDRFGRSITEKRSMFEESETGKQGRFDASEAGKEGRFDQREGRLERNALIQQDQKHAMLEQQRARLESQIVANKDRTMLGQWRAILNAQHARAQEVIGSAAAGMDAKERKRLLADEDTFYTAKIKEMQGVMNGDQKGAPAADSGPAKVASPEEAAKLKPGTRYTTPDGTEYTR